MVKLLRQTWANLKLKYVLWQISKDFEEEITSNINRTNNSIEYESQVVQTKYENGIKNMKRHIRSRGSNLESTLVETEDLVRVAKVETEAQKELREAREAIIVAKGSDIKSEADRERMIEKRIQMMYEVQDYRDKRRRLKDVANAKKQDDEELMNVLIKEYEDKYGKLRPKSNT